MGNAASSVDPRYVRIWMNLTQMQSNETRMSMLETLMVGPEFVQAAKKVGVYAMILQWVAAYRRGENPYWPGAPAPQRHVQTQQRGYPPMPAQQHQPQPQPQPQQHQQRPTTSTLATVPPPKRALDTLHESYQVLGIDDSKPLTHETLRSAYKKSAARAHPDRGGSAKAFDAVTRAFLYLEEVLNKLIPKVATEGDDVRFTAPVTKETALKAREVHLTKYDAEMAASAIQDPVTAPAKRRAPVALNPKKLDMQVFNQLFEENRLPDPDQDGYGDWLRSQDSEVRRSAASESALRSKFNKDVFNRTFVEQAATQTRDATTDLTCYQTPDAITHSQGVELGAGRPAHYISPMGAKTAYTDLKYAYGEGATFSQQVSDVRVSEKGKTFDQAKRERESAPTPLTSQEMAAVEALDRQKRAAEEERRRRLAVHDVEAESTYSKLQRRLMIQQ